jgi:uncharacterized membrane protein
MTVYLWIKWIHVLSSVLLVGTGLGSAFYLYFAHKGGNQRAIIEVIQLVVKADHWFTLPTAIIQPVTGAWMLSILQIGFAQQWIVWAAAFYLIAACCYIPVYFLQLRMRHIALESGKNQQALPQIYWQYARYWEWLGYPAFTAMLAVFWLMVFKPV